jgi:branched-chain amino acid transport system permease protein
LVQTLTIAYVSSGLSDAIIFSILFVVLLVRPTGFFGTLRKEQRVARE